MMSLDTKREALSRSGGHANQLDVVLKRYDALLDKIAQYSVADKNKAKNTETYRKAEQKQ